MNLSKEESAAYLLALEKRIEYEDKKLLEWGWIKTEAGWLEPDERVLVAFCDAYNWAVGRYLEKNGWKTIVEIEQWGRPHWKKPIQRWARYQSPTSKRVYTFLEAVEIAESEWDEKIWPNQCCKHTIALNALLGNNFSGNEIKTWFARTEEHLLELVND